MRGQKATTIKDFANVSKSTKTPTAKPAIARPMRMTRSRTAAAYAAEPAIEVAPAATRKRKLPDPVSTAIPAKKTKKLPGPTTPRKKKPTTISAYFSPVAAKSAIPETITESALNPVAETVEETKAVEPVVETTAVSQVAETTAVAQ
ncbi:hypothetical protein GGI18_002354, partial [Coemansia linderi]